MIYIMETDGTGAIQEYTGDATVTFQDDLPNDYPNVTLAGEEFQFTLDLDRDGRKVWAKVFRMQKYKATEWIFPRKKKRGTARRRRKENGLRRCH